METLYILFQPEVNIRVSMSQDYRARCSGPRYDFEPPIQVLVDLYDDERLGELAHLETEYHLPEAPRWTQGHCGIGPCIDCQRTSWEVKYKPIFEDYWF